jgi:hypothetical protein
MILNTRRRLIGTSLAMVGLFLISSLWTRKPLQGPDAGMRRSDELWEFGVFPWLRLWRCDSGSALGAGVCSDIDAIGVAVNASLSMVVGFSMWLAAGWLARQTAIRGGCDACGHLLALERSSGRCPECGEAPRLDDSVFGISRGSWLHCVLALALLGTGAAAKTMLALLSASKRLLEAFDVSAPSALHGEWSAEVTRFSSLLLIAGMLTYLMWIVREPSKLPRSSLAGRLLRWRR